MKRIALSFIAILILAAVSLAAPRYVASQKEAPFHLTSCRWAKEISRANLEEFNTREEAIKAGHQPCKVCKPYSHVSGCAVRGGVEFIVRKE